MWNSAAALNYLVKLSFNEDPHPNVFYAYWSLRAVLHLYEVYRDVNCMWIVMWISIWFWNTGIPWCSAGKESVYNARDAGSIPGSERSTGEGIGYPLQYSWVSLVAQLVKNPPAMWETWVLSLCWEDTLEKATGEYPLQYSGLKNSIDYSIGLQRVGHNEQFSVWNTALVLGKSESLEK